jgi:hypothetical protein
MPTAADIYAAYPRKQAKLAALKSIEKAMRSEDGDVLLKATQDYAAAVAMWDEGDKAFVPLPTTWFNQGRWMDDRKNWFRGKAPPTIRAVN